MNELWKHTRISEKEKDFLWSAISEENKKNISNTLAGNISKSEQLKDKDNWFYEKVLKKHTEKMFYRNWDNFSKYHIDEERPLPEFELYSFWVNYMKQHEFNPLHNHSGFLYSFVVFMKIPTHWKEQHALPISANSNSPCASDFVFVLTQKDNKNAVVFNFPLSPEDEGRMLFFPATLQHMVYPFYECEEERITISGNIFFVDPNRPKMQEISVSEYEKAKNKLKLMENDVQEFKKELELMKKVEENRGSN